jgi:hypothetical protein
MYPQPDSLAKADATVSASASMSSPVAVRNGTITGC